MDRIAAYEHELTQYALQRLSEIPDMHIFGNPSHREGVISFQVGNIHPLDLGTLLDRLGIAIGTPLCRAADAPSGSRRNSPCFLWPV